MTDDSKAMHLMLAVGAFETVKAHEEDANPKSARSRAIQGAMDKVMKVVDLYRLNAWEDAKLKKAGRLLDEIEVRTNQTFNPKLVGRDSKGRFTKLGAKP